MVEILNSTYVKADLKQVADNVSQMNDEEITLLLSLLGDLEEFLWYFRWLGHWACLLRSKAIFQTV